MSLDNDIRRSLERHAEDVQPRARAFDRVEHRVRRAHTQRVAIGATLVVALIAALSVVLPRLGGDTRDGGFAIPGETPSSTPTPAPDDERVTVRDEQDGYQLRMPPDWRVTEFEGVVELLPPGMVGTAAGEDTFAVSLMLYGEEYQRADPNTMVAGRSASRSMTRRNGYAYHVDWSGSTCDGSSCTLWIFIDPPTGELADRFGDDAQRVVESIQHIDDAALPSGEVRTRRGVISADVSFDERTALLVRFLEARAHGGGAEDFLSPTFTDPYEGDLYTIGGEAILTFEVTGGAEADASSSEFTVVLDGTATETIGVGAGSSGLEIRFVTPA